MKKQLLLPECEWILTDEARNDSRLNPTDKNILAVLQYMFDSKEPLDDGFYSIVLRSSNKVPYTLEGTLNDFGFKVDGTTVGRSINKLWRLGYIDYRRGFSNANGGQCSRIMIFKGTIDATVSMTAHYSGIAHSNYITEDDKKLSTGVSGSCSGIAHIEIETEKETENSNSTIAISTLSSKCGGTENESDFTVAEDTSFVGNGETFNIKNFVLDHICDGNVMGDLLELAIDTLGWFTNDVQVERVVGVINSKCESVQLDPDFFKDRINAIQEKADSERLTKIIHT